MLSYAWVNFVIETLQECHTSSLALIECHSILNKLQIIKNDGEEFHCTESLNETVSLTRLYQSSVKIHYVIEEPSIFQPRHLQCTLASEAM